MPHSDQDLGAHKHKAHHTKQMMKTFFRDLAFLIGCLVIYDVFLIGRIISLAQAVFLSSLVLVYIFIIFQMNKADS